MFELKWFGLLKSVCRRRGRIIAFRRPLLWRRSHRRGATLLGLFRRRSSQRGASQKGFFEVRFQRLLADNLIKLASSNIARNFRLVRATGNLCDASGRACSRRHFIFGAIFHHSNFTSGAQTLRRQMLRTCSGGCCLSQTRLSCPISSYQCRALGHLFLVLYLLQLSAIIARCHYLLHTSNELLSTCACAVRASVEAAGSVLRHRRGAHKSVVVVVVARRGRHFEVVLWISSARWIVFVEQRIRFPEVERTVAVLVMKIKASRTNARTC